MWCFFFFSSRRRHTRSYGDWSSDVCSSDLLLEVQPGERALQASEVAGPGLPRRAAQRQVRLEGPGLRGEPERRELALDAMLQQFERRVCGDPRPHDARPLEVGKDAE